MVLGFASQKSGVKFVQKAQEFEVLSFKKHFASGFAGYKDWFIEAFDRPGYTVEAGRGTNPLPLSQFDERYRKNREIMTIGALVT